jgi:hypothetical protein
MQCPRCDGQGEIKLVQVRTIGTFLQVCDECEATWLDGEQPRIESFCDFGTYMKSHGMKGLWSEVTIISNH